MEQTRIDVGPATAPARNGAPRLIGGIALWAAAMLAGVLAAAFFVMKSMTWIGGYTGGFWQDDEGAGLVVGIALVLAWLVLLAASIAVMFRGALRGSRAAHVTAIVLAVVSLVVIGGWLLLLIP
ncbi:hypothetical protein JOD63_002173 [Microbacterium terrae]|uniref:Uncharacterized protein n=1 Tax=Microbacterium terrae TaxID=69369 RepID=A0A0M2H8I2_9MICO|nr:hypothetical protein [Microbacterium terrae]KJL40916.1 hypothetical protein RS81_01460 [Microbacterium terrae]MBP1078205.1 hypothetical protein [Microbacterium terrae]